MECAENLTKLSASDDFVSANHENEAPKVESSREIKQEIEHDAEIEEGQLVPESDMNNAVTNPTISKEKVHFSGTVRVDEEVSPVRNVAANGSLVVEEKTVIGCHHIDSIKSGVKRSRIVENQSSVHVKYDSLPRDSKRKLEELLQQWSAWHARYCSSSPDLFGVFESGEETYFPALHIGVDKKSEVSFWMDNQSRNSEGDSFMQVDEDSVPLYDRGYALGLTSEDRTGNQEGFKEPEDAFRCFNCSSYNHSLKDCPKPRNNAAVNNARKQLKSRRNQTPGSRNPSRYYEKSSAGKYDGLRPGGLDAETRQLLGLGDLDPPPWLSRMRELGYPPGYLGLEEEEESSGITIFGDEETGAAVADHEDGEILEVVDPSVPRKKKTVKFPGINAPIPENADPWRWNARSWSSRREPMEDLPFQDGEEEKNRSDTWSRRRKNFSGDFRNEPSGSSRYPLKYDINYEYDDRGSGSNHSYRRGGMKSTRRSSPTCSERDENSGHYQREDSPSYGLYSSSSYPCPSKRLSDGNSGGREKKDSADYSSRNRDRDERQRSSSSRR